MKNAMELGRAYSHPFWFNMSKFWNWFYSRCVALFVLFGSSAAISVSLISWTFNRSDTAIMVAISAAVIMIVYMVCAVSYDANQHPVE